MANGPYHAVVRHVNCLFHQGTAGGTGERQLLDKFLADGDETSFEAIVARHGPAVLRVCRQLLDDPNDVDDAFQATFLILVRKGRSLHRRDALGGWLYGVAYRVAVRARRCRRMRPAPGSDPADLDQTGQVEQDELRETVRREVARLPEKYRIPIMLCYLEGLSHLEAAERLGWPVGTVRGRMARGRDLLRNRLVRRGVTWSALTTTLMTASDARSSTVPEALLESTIRAASRCVLKSSLAGTLSSPAIALTEGVLTSMLWNKLKLLALAVAGTSVLTAGLAVLSRDLPPRASAAENASGNAHARNGWRRPVQARPIPVARNGVALNSADDTTKAQGATANEDADSGHTKSKLDEASRREEVAEKLTFQQADIELREIELQAEKDEIQELMKLLRAKELEAGQPVVGKTEGQIELLQKQRDEELRRLEQRLAMRKDSFPEHHRTLSRMKREVERLELSLRTAPPGVRTGVAPVHSGRSEAARPRSVDGSSTAQLEEAQLDVELLKADLQATLTQLLGAQRDLESYERITQAPEVPDAAPKKDDGASKAFERQIRRDRQGVAALRARYLKDKARLTKAEQDLVDLESNSDAPRNGAELTGGLSRRLEQLEKKLDRLIQSLDKK